MGGERQVCPEPLHGADWPDQQGRREGRVSGGPEEDPTEDSVL